VPAQVKPLIDKTVADQLEAMQARIRSDPSLERNARLQWANACRSIPLQGAGAGSSLPALWLELRPTRAIAAQPRVDASAVTLTLGIEAEAVSPWCRPSPTARFPAVIGIVPPIPSRVSIGVRSTSVHQHQQDRGSTVRRPDVSGGRFGLGRCHREARDRCGIGDRLLISLLVNAKEKKSFFRLGGEADVHIWGKRCSIRCSRACG